MLGEFGYIGLFLLIAILFPAGGLITSYVISPRAKTKSAIRGRPYESGMETIGPTWVQYHAQYYLYALIFVIFDVEAIFLFPWALQFNQLGLYAFVEVAIFVAILLVGFVYAWKKRALEWR